MRYGQAIETLLDAGFTVDPYIIYAYSDTVAWDHVIAQAPVGGTVMNYQAVPIRLTVSMGPAMPVSQSITADTTLVTADTTTVTADNQT